MLLAAAAASFATLSCGALPSKPILSPNESQRAVPSAENLSRVDSGPSSSAYEFQIERRGNDIHFVVLFAPVREQDRLRFDAQPTTGTSWTFVIRLDTDQNGGPLTGSGTDFTLLPAPGDRLDVYRSWPSYGLATEVDLQALPGRIQFKIPASALRNDDGLMNYVLTIYEIVVLPHDYDYFEIASISGTNNPPLTEARQVPVVTSMRTEVRNDCLYLRAQIAPRDPSYPAFYDPETPGGWSLQLFLNTDQAPTGYAHAYDYLVRGVERAADGSFVIRRIDELGWREVTGYARFILQPRDLELRIPLAAIGNDDGRLDYRLELYATEPCPACQGGFTSGYVSQSSGSTDDPRGLRIGQQNYLRPVDP